MVTSSADNLVAIVDADAGWQSRLLDHLQSMGIKANRYSSAEQLLQDWDNIHPKHCCCVVSEIDLPGMQGNELQRVLRDRFAFSSLIFFVEQIRVRQVVESMRRGAVAVVEKRDGLGPVAELVDQEFELARQRWPAEQQRQEVLSQLQSLTDGERQVLRGILGGRLNKEIAHQLRLSIRTVEQRRRQIFRKLDVQHPACLAQKVMQVAKSEPSQTLDELFRLGVGHQPIGYDRPAPHQPERPRYSASERRALAQE
jgi:FixJ family two-component response regulator